MNAFIYKFDELPLAIVDGIEAGFVNGQAEIEYTDSGLWQVGSVSLEGFGKRNATGKREWPQVPISDAIAAVIRLRLNKEWRPKVQNAVIEELQLMREAAE
jgi:hypothetical protein